MYYIVVVVDDVFITRQKLKQQQSMHAKYRKQNNSNSSMPYAIGYEHRSILNLKHTNQYSHTTLISYIGCGVVICPQVYQ